MTTPDNQYKYSVKKWTNLKQYYIVKEQRERESKKNVFKNRGENRHDRLSREFHLVGHIIGLNSAL